MSTFEAFARAYAEARSHDALSDADARAFFERHFVPALVRPDIGERGFVTGFYEPVVEASPCSYRNLPHSRCWRVRPIWSTSTTSTGQPVSIHTSPSAAATEAGVVAYFDRGEIERGALGGRNLEIAWLADPVDAFFIHVQGAARLVMTDGSLCRVTYAAKSGHRFSGPGRILADLGEIPLADVTMQSIRAWFRSHPDRIDEILWQNRSYIFFREAAVEDPALGPVAAAKVPLQPGRSIAVDRLLHTFGTPFYIDAPELLAFEGKPFRRLMIAQDTGSAITGAARGDLFAGSGDAAGEIAGVVRAAADFYALIPRALAGTGSPMSRAPQTPLSDEDRVLWSLVARTAKPLKGTKAVTVPVIEPDHDGGSAWPRMCRQPTRPALAPTAPAPHAQPTALDRPTREKLSAGKLPIEGRVDLHGMTQQQAHALLLSFLIRAHAGGVRYVLVITGKGSSSGGEGVLRRAVPGWLATPAFRALVSSHDHAARNHGGAGALYIRLRRRKPAMTPLGEKMRALRARQGVSQKQMAAALGVSAAYLSALEHGRRGAPNWALVQKIIGYFNVIWDEAEELQRLAKISDPRVVIDTSGLSPEATELANLLADRIGLLDQAEFAHWSKPPTENGSRDLPTVVRSALGQRYCEPASYPPSSERRTSSIRTAPASSGSLSLTSQP